MDGFRDVILCHILFTVNKILKQGNIKTTDIDVAAMLYFLFPYQDERVHDYPGWKNPWFKKQLDSAGMYDVQLNRNRQSERPI